MQIREPTSNSALKLVGGLLCALYEIPVSSAVKSGDLVVFGDLPFGILHALFCDSRK